MENKKKLHLLKKELSRVSKYTKAKYNYLKLKNFKNRKELIISINELKFSISVYKRLLRLYKKELLIINKKNYCHFINTSYQKTKSGCLKLSLNNPIYSSISHLKSLELYFKQKQDYEKCEIIHLRISQLDS